MAVTTNYSFKKRKMGHPVRDDDVGDNLDLIDTTIKARETEIDALEALADGKILVGDGDGVAADVAMSGDITIANTGATAIGTDKVITTKIKDSNVTLAKLASGITPAYIVVYAGEYTWSDGGASCAETVTGALASDIVIASIQSAPAQAAYLKSVAVTENTVTTTLSAANTGNDAVIAYIVLRAAS